MNIKPKIEFLRIYTKVPDVVSRFYTLLGFKVEKSKPLADYMCVSGELSILIKKQDENPSASETQGFLIDISYESINCLNQIVNLLRVENFIVEKEENLFSGDYYVCSDGSGNHVIISC